MMDPERPKQAYVRIERKSTQSVEDIDQSQYYADIDPIIFLVTYFHYPSGNLTWEVDLTAPDSNIDSLLMGINWKTDMWTHIAKRMPRLQIIAHNYFPPPEAQPKDLDSFQEFLLDQREKNKIDEFDKFLLELWQKNQNAF